MGGRFRAWTPEEDATLSELYRLHDSSWEGWEVALPGRSTQALRIRAQHIGVAAKRAPEWTTVEEDALRRLYPTLGADCADECPELAGRTREAVYKRAKALGLVRGLRPRVVARGDDGQGGEGIGMEKKPKASGELRQWSERNCGGYVDGELREELCAIADRIDRETVELPHDGDGVPIHVGDTVFGRMSHVKMAISALRIVDSGWVVYINGGACRVDAVDVSHTRPDSLKRIADELDEMVDAARHADDTCDRLADLAERIRKLEAKEG